MKCGALIGLKGIGQSREISPAREMDGRDELCFCYANNAMGSSRGGIGRGGKCCHHSPNYKVGVAFEICGTHQERVAKIYAG